MGPTNPIVKLTKYKKVASMADITKLPELSLSNQICCCGRVPCLDSSNGAHECHLPMDIAPTSAEVQHLDSLAQITEKSFPKIENSCELTGEDDVSSQEDMECSSPQQFRSGTLTRRSRRTSREQRYKEHIAQSVDHSILDLKTDCNSSSKNETGTQCTKMKTDDKSQHDILIDLIDDNITSTVNKTLCLSSNKNEKNVRGHTLDIPAKGFSGIGPRGGVRRHSIHSGYLTLPRMTGLVGLTLPDLKTRRKGENSSPMSVGMAALLDLKIFKHESSSNICRHSQSSRCPGSPGTPLPNRPSTISYSSRFKNNIGRRRKSITSIENLFKSIRSISSPTPPVIEECEDISDPPRAAVGNPSKIFKKQLSSPSLRSPNCEPSSSSSSCHSSPVPTPQLVRKCISHTPSSPSFTEEPLDLEEIIQVGEEFLRSSPSSTLAILKVPILFSCFLLSFIP